MPGVERPAVETNVFSITERLDLFFGAVMAMLAQRLQGACKELDAIAMVGHDMVGDSSRHRNAALLQAKFAQRMDHELIPANLLPARRAVQIVPRPRLRAHVYPPALRLFTREYLFT